MRFNIAINFSAQPSYVNVYNYQYLQNSFTRSTRFTIIDLSRYLIRILEKNITYIDQKIEL